MAATNTQTPPAGKVVSSVASAPGKLILFGEHAVVHARLAIASCLSDLRIFSSVVRRVYRVDEGLCCASAACVCVV